MIKTLDKIRIIIEVILFPIGLVVIILIISLFNVFDWIAKVIHR